MNDKSIEAQPPKKVVVCGGGIIGVCTAYFLSKKGIAVILIEKSSIACAASGKAGGFLALHMCDGGPLSSLARASYDLHRSLAQELDGPRSYGYRPLDTISGSLVESKQLRPTSPILPSWVDGPLESPTIIGTNETTAQVHPQLFTRALLANAVAEYGVEVVTGKVESVVVEGGAVAVKVSGGEIIGGDAVVLALGPWSRWFSQLPIMSRVYGKKVHSLILEPKLGGEITPHALFINYYSAQGDGPMDSNVFPRPSGEVYICGPSTEVEVPKELEGIFPDRVSIDMLKGVANCVSSHLREGNVSVKAEQACIMPCTEDDMPIMGEVPGMKGCYVASGHGYWGILNGPASGAAMAELVVDGYCSIIDINPFSPTRFF